MSTQNQLRYASTFLSHSTNDKDLVRAVAKHLCQRGVIVWLDEIELSHGSLDKQLKQAVHEQPVFTLFLSQAFIDSNWCKDEVQAALQREGLEHLFPVYLGDPLTLVKQHELLRSRFLHPDGDRVNQLGCFHDPNNPENPAPDAVAKKIAKAVYDQTIPGKWTDIAIVIDQRGSGSISGEPDLPANIATLDIPVVTFRSNIEARQQRETLTGDDWLDMSNSMAFAISEALGTLRSEPCKVRILGNSQAGLMWAIGRHFNRTTSAELFVYGRNNAVVTNRGQDRLRPLVNGKSDCAQLLTGSLPAEKVALFIGTADSYFIKDAQKAAATIPFLHIVSKNEINESDVMPFVSDIVTAVGHLRNTYGINEIMLFWATANHVAVLAAANLTSHVIPNIQFMEWDHAHSQYVYLPMPNC
ncbi:MAG: toll/interleukin-1 receptor domain-containing protein [Methylococcales bacterium]|nr:toll/interleukin-1 receptor domain-containing protein [Methylococcales bacterium]MDD5630926.1 toll/interleukin-1 receptor domain-containing protein [Methylococcales bacterium]